MSPRFARAWPPESVTAAKLKRRVIGASAVLRSSESCSSAGAEKATVFVETHGFSSSSSASRKVSVASGFSSRAPPAVPVPKPQKA